MKRSIFLIVGLLACGPLADCSLNPQPFPPNSGPVASNGGRAGDIGGGSSGSGSSSGNSSAGPSAFDAAAPPPFSTDAGVLVVIGDAGTEASVTNTDGTATSDGAANADAASWDAAPARTDVDAPSEAFGPDDATKELKTAPDAPSGHHAADAVSEATPEEGD